MGRADELADGTERPGKVVELEAVVRAIEAYEAVRWSTGGKTGEKW
jgi:hypothetical protein